MGNSVGKLGMCFTGGGESTHHRHGSIDPFDEGLGHSFCYVRPDPARMPPKIPSSEESVSSIFRSISGASVSANTSTPPLSSAAFVDATSSSGPIFESSTYFASAPLQLQPASRLSAPITDRGFMSGPIERAGFLSGPIDRAIFSGPLDRSFSHNAVRRKGSLIRGLRRALSKTFRQSSVVAPVKWVLRHDSWAFSSKNSGTVENIPVSGNLSLDETESWESQNLLVQWAQGKAGEDRVHVVVSDEHGWVFVGIYDGFNGPDATDFLLSNLYSFVQKELKGLLWDDSSSNTCSSTTTLNSSESRSSSFSEVEAASVSRYCQEPENYSKKSKNYRGVCNKREENQRRWKCEWDKERLELDRRLKEQWNQNDCSRSINHSDVLKALSEALRKTEEAYFDVADKMVDENPELALMGSCVVAMLMKGEDVYVMNVGDSRAVLAQNKEPHLRLDQDLEMINEECLYDFRVSNDGAVKATLNACQLTMDHSTCVEEEVLRIKEEHPDDNCAVVNDRVKGSLKVTRAFGAGFLKQAKWNDAVLEMFRIEYIGTSSYINCLPSLYHHKLCPKDQFLILSSDGLYQYFTNEEAVTEVEFFIILNPEGDPAQHLIEEVLFRAAKKAGMELYELLEIPQGDRRKYHDDVSIIIISFQGRIWRSCV